MRRETFLTGLVKRNDIIGRVKQDFHSLDSYYCLITNEKVFIEYFKKGNAKIIQPHWLFFSCDTMGYQNFIITDRSLYYSNKTEVIPFK